jgi:hypothetical protein
MAVTINIPHDPTKITIFDTANVISGNSPIITTFKSARVSFNAVNIAPLGSAILALVNTNTDWTGGVFVSMVGHQGGIPFINGYTNGNGSIDIFITNLDTANNINQIEFKFIDLGQ